MNKINTIGYKLVKNNTQTADKAPYTALPVPVGSLAFDNILAKMIDEGTFMTKATAQYLLKAFFEYAADEIGDKVVRISTGTVSLYPAISGSFPSEDAEFDVTKNTLYVGASFSQALRDSVAGVSPAYLGDPNAKSTVKLASVMDLASKTMGVIDGTNAFRLAGVNLTVPDGADESLALYSKDLMTKVCDITVSENDGGLYLKCSLPNSAAIAKGTYKIRLASHGLDPTDPLAVVALPVTLVSAVVPAPVPLAVSTDGTLKVMTAKADGSDWGFTGSGFQTWTSGQRGIPMIEYLFGDERVSVDDFIVSADGTSFRPTDEMIAACLVNLGDLGACDGTAMIRFVPGPDTASEVLSVPVRYNPA